MSEHGNTNNYSRSNQWEDLAASLIIGTIFFTAQILYTIFLITFNLLTLLVRK